MKILIIIPAYNEEKSIVKTVDSLENSKVKIDYIVINDGSKDDTKKVLRNNNMRYLDLPNNLGIGGAVQSGYKYALENKYDIAIQFDGDGQHDAKYISNLIQEIEQGANMAIGSRYIQELSKFKSTFMRRVGKNFLSLLIKIATGTKVYDPTSGYRAVDKKIIELFADHYPSDYPEPDTIVEVLKLGHKIKEIPVEMNERKEGKSSISPFKSIYYMIKVSISILFTGLNVKKVKKNGN